MRPVEGQREIDSIFALEYYSARIIFVHYIPDVHGFTRRTSGAGKQIKCRHFIHFLYFMVSGSD